MRTFLTTILLVIIMVSCKDTDETITNQGINITPDQTNIINASNKFGMSMFQKEQSDSATNYLISPMSINIALSMALNGATGDNYTEMKNVMNLNNIELGSFNSSYKDLIKQLTSSDTKTQLYSANSICQALNFPVKSDYVNSLTNYFSAQHFLRNTNSTEFIDELFNWIKEKTYGKIEKVEGVTPGSFLYLVNAIYFKSDWVKTFNPDYTKLEGFANSDGTLSQVNMMNMKDSTARCYSDEYVKAIDLKYGNGNYSMTFILPNDNINLTDYISSFTNEKYKNITDNLKEKEAVIKIPKCKLGYLTKLNKTLMNLGMNLAFTTGGFGNISDIPLGINQVIHKTAMDIDEKGTSAAAVTVIDFKNSIPNLFEFYANRPYIIVLREVSTNYILFIGRINKL